MIEKISATLAEFICTNLPNENNDSKYEILKYGFECIINTGIPCIIYFIVSIINHMQLETLIWFIVFIFYRNLIGGYHASSHFKCILFSILILDNIAHSLSCSIFVGVLSSELLFIFYLLKLHI